MPYMLTYKTGDGKSDFHMCSDMDNALHMAEHFRNADDASDVAVYRTEEVKIEFKAYFKAEVDEIAPGGTGRFADPATGTSESVPSDEVPRMPPIETPLVETPVAVQAEVIESVDSGMPQAEVEAEPEVATPAGDATFGIFARS